MHIAFIPTHDVRLVAGLYGKKNVRNSVSDSELVAVFLFTIKMNARGGG